MATATEAPKPVEKPKAVEKWFTVYEAMGMTGFKRTFLYGEMEAGRLRSVKAGGGRRIPESALAEWQARFDGSGEVAGI